MKFYLETEHPIAEDSPDHIQPRATARDNSKNRNFNKSLRDLYPDRPLAVLDFGCAGGGMVRTLIEDGFTAIGLEGSDYNLENQSKEWPYIPDNLFTCDIGFPFVLHTGDGKPYQFDIVTAWEFVEHLPEDRLPTMIANAKKHLKVGGLMVGSTNKFGSVFDGVEHHLTQQPISWWLELFDGLGFERRLDLEHYFEKREAWVRNVRDKFVLEKR